MTDCSKTEVFFGELDRMCECFADECELCPFDKHLVGESACDSFIRKCPEKAITIVQKWSDEHPAPKPKTYADDFFEKFPHARGYSFDYDGTKVPSELMRCMLYNIGYACEFEGSKFCDADRRADCWREPYPEQEVHDG